MPIVLPKSKIAPVRISPKRLLLYSMPKVGKTDMLAQLPSCLILDADPDQGAGLYECMRQPINSTADVYEVLDAIEAEGGIRHSKGIPKDSPDLFPYRFLAMDPINEFESFALESATVKYRNGPLNSKKKFEEKGFTKVTELPEGGGYFYLWNELTAIVNNVAGCCTNQIITAHVREKKLGGKDEKTGDQAVVNDIDLTGKMSSILCGMVDAIGYVYRRHDKDHKGELWISFETNDSAVMGARQKYLAGQKMPFTWDRIYPDLIVREEDGTYRLKTAEETAAFVL